MPTKKEKAIDTDWLKDTLADAEETLSKAISLLEENPRHAQGILETYHALIDALSRPNRCLIVAS